MIIRTSVPLKKEVIIKPVVKQEEVKSLDNEIVHKSKKRKTISTPIVVEEIPVVVDEIVEEEKIDLSKWLEEDIDE